MKSSTQKIPWTGNRQIINPILTVSGLLTMVSGAFMFFHFQSTVVVGLHEIMGLIFITSGILHTAVNWRALLKTLGAKKQQYVIMAAIVLCVVIMVGSAIISPDSHGKKDTPGHNRGNMVGGLGQR